MELLVTLSVIRVTLVYLKVFQLAEMLFLVNEFTLPSFAVSLHLGVFTPQSELLMCL